MTLAVFDSTYVVPASVVVFFGLPLVFTLFFGRTFCAAVCPLGAVQELIAIRPVTVPRWLDEALGLCAYVYLGFAVILAAGGMAFVICQYDPYVAIFRLSGEFHMLVFGACLLLIGVFVGRPYCRYLCPYGVAAANLVAVDKVARADHPDRLYRMPSLCGCLPLRCDSPPHCSAVSCATGGGKRRALWTLVCLPLILAVLTAAGTLLADSLASWNANVRLATQLWQQDLDKTTPPTAASEAFRLSGGDADALDAAALKTRQDCRVSGGMLGAWVGLVISSKLLSLSLRRQALNTPRIGPIASRALVASSLARLRWSAWD